MGQDKKKLPSVNHWLPRFHEANADIEAYLQFADKSYSENLTDDAWESYHEEKLQKVFRYVKTRSPFYQDRLSTFSDHKVTLQNLRKLPFTYKADLQSCGADIFSKQVRDGTVYYETSGTTGKPSPTPRTWFESIASNYHFSRNFSHLVNTHFPSRKPIIGIVGPTELHALGDSIGEICRNADISHVKMWPYSPMIGYKRANELVSQLGIDVLFGSPAVILPMIRLACKSKESHNVFSEAVKLILTLGEITSSAMRKNISHLLGGALCQPGNYGANEMFVVSSSCGFGHMHFAKQNYIAEIIDPFTEELIEDGRVGELVVTMLIPGIRPMIRYRTGDLVSMVSEQCQCGSPGENIINHGRVSDIIMIGDQHFFASNLEQIIMKNVTGFFGYQLTITNVDGKDHVLVELEPILEINDRDSISNMIQEQVADKLQASVSVRIVEELPAVVNTGGLTSWKSARVNDQRIDVSEGRKASLDLAARWLSGYTPRLKTV